jgi:hypothetical protein
MPGASERPPAREIDKKVRLAQELARPLRNTQNVRRGFEISQRLAEATHISYPTGAVFEEWFGSR